jgi:hypothetical protein
MLAAHCGVSGWNGITLAARAAAIGSLHGAGSATAASAASSTAVVPRCFGVLSLSQQYRVERLEAPLRQCSTLVPMSL